VTKKVFDDIFSIARLYNFACSYGASPIRIYPIMMSIVLYHYKNLKEKYFVKSFSSNFNDINNNENTTLKRMPKQNEQEQMIIDNIIDELEKKRKYSHNQKERGSIQR
jgi:hypothetical protein